VSIDFTFLVQLRRERIAERIRALQELVPSVNKVSNLLLCSSSLMLKLYPRGKERGAVLMIAKLNKEREYKGKEAWISSLLNQYYFFLREVGTYNCSLKYGF
jgi:hypothetical protein